MYIEIDTSILGGDIEDFHARVSELEAARLQVFQSIEQLSAMWEGDAHDVFEAQVRNDTAMMQSLEKNLRHLLECMQYARDEYNRCADSVGDKIASIRLSGDT